MFDRIAIFAGNFIDSFKPEDHTDSGVTQQFIGTGNGFDYAHPAEALVGTIAALTAKVIMPAVIVGALVIITIAGIRYIISSGNEDQMQQAKKTLMYGIFGFVLAIMAWTIISVTISVIDHISSPQVLIMMGDLDGKTATMNVAGIPAEQIPDAEIKWTADNSALSECNNQVGCSHTFDSPGTHNMRVSAVIKDGDKTVPVNNKKEFVIPGDIGEAVLKSLMNGNKLRLDLSGIDPDAVTTIKWNITGPSTNPQIRTIDCPGAAECLGADGKSGVELLAGDPGDYEIQADISYADDTTGQVTADAVVEETGEFYITAEPGDDAYTYNLKINGGEPASFQGIMWDVGTEGMPSDPDVADPGITELTDWRFPRDGSYTVSATIEYGADSNDTEVKDVGPLVIDVTENAELECDPPEGTSVSCTIINYNDDLIENIAWTTDGTPKEDCSNSDSCTHDFQNSEKTHTLAATIQYVAYPAGGDANITIEKEFNFGVDAEKFTYTVTPVKDDETGENAIFMHEFVISNFNPDLLADDGIEIDYNGTGDFVPVEEAENIQVREVTFYHFYKTPGNYDSVARVTYKGGDPIDITQAVSVRDPEEQDPKLAIEFVTKNGIKNAKVVNFGILRETEKIDAQIEGDDDSSMHRIIIKDSGEAIIPENLEPEVSYDITAEVFYQNGDSYIAQFKREGLESDISRFLESSNSKNAIFLKRFFVLRNSNFTADSNLYLENRYCDYLEVDYGNGEGFIPRKVGEHSIIGTCTLWSYKPQRPRYDFEWAYKQPGDYNLQIRTRKGESYSEPTALENNPIHIPEPSATIEVLPSATNPGCDTCSLIRISNQKLGIEDEIKEASIITYKAGSPEDPAGTGDVTTNVNIENTFEIEHQIKSHADMYNPRNGRTIRGIYGDYQYGLKVVYYNGYEAFFENPKIISVPKPA